MFSQEGEFKLTRKNYFKIILCILIVSFTLAGCTQNANNNIPEGSSVTGSNKTEKPAEEALPPNEEEAPKSTMTAPTLYSKALGLDWNYTAYLPKSYNEEGSTQTYPVIYLLHGAYGNHRNLVERFPIQEQLDEAINTGKLAESIVVFVDGFNSFYINGPALKMETAIIEDLIPQIDALYRTDNSRDSRSIGGISMGGHGAASLALKHPDLFSKAVLISPAVWETVDENTATYSWHLFRTNEGEFDDAMWEANHPASFLKSYADQDQKVDFFIITGLADQTVAYEDVDRFAEKLQSVAEVEYIKDEDGIHAWTYWGQAMPKALEFIGKQ